MADSPKQSGGQPTELSMEKRLLLAFILMGAVLFLTPYFFKSTPPAEQPPPGAPVEQVNETKAPPPPSEEPPAAPAPTTPETAVAPSAAVAAEAEESLTIDTDLYKVVFTNRGAVVKSWLLKDFADSEGNPVELVAQAAVDKVGYPFHIEFVDGAPALDPNSGLFKVTRTEDGLGLDFELSDGVTAYRKSFRFKRDQYLTGVVSEATHNGKLVPHLLSWRGGFGDATATKASAKEHSLYYDLTERKLVLNDSTEADEGPITFRGNCSFAGLEDTFFAAVVLPGNGGDFAIRTFSDLLLDPKTEKETPYVGSAVGGAGRNEFPLFVGPKDIDLLKEIDPRLQQLVDFGWFSFLAKPLFIALKWTHANIVPNWGWAIVLLTVAINMLTVPLKFTSMKSMKKMQVLQPEIKKIQEKYKGLSLRDPKKQHQNEELMALYKKHDVNPMGGCLPMALQIPFFFAFYKVLSVAIELRGADWLWVTDLSRPETLPIRVLPVTMVASQFAMQKMTPTTAVGSGSQQRVMMLMPLMMGFLFYGVSSGLVLYWLTSNLVGVAQQQLMNKFSHSAEIKVETPPVTKPKKKGRRK